MTQCLDPILKHVHLDLHHPHVRIPIGPGNLAMPASQFLHRVIEQDLQPLEIMIPGWMTCEQGGVRFGLSQEAFIECLVLAPVRFRNLLLSLVKLLFRDSHLIAFLAPPRTLHSAMGHPLVPSHAPRPSRSLVGERLGRNSHGTVGTR